MAAPDLIKLPGLVEDAQCVALMREHRWPQGVRCPACGGGVIRDGHDDTQPCRQRRRCKACAGRFDDLDHGDNPDLCRARHKHESSPWSVMASILWKLNKGGQFKSPDLSTPTAQSSLKTWIELRFEKPVIVQKGISRRSKKLRSG